MGLDNSPRQIATNVNCVTVARSSGARLRTLLVALACLAAPAAFAISACTCGFQDGKFTLRTMTLDGDTSDWAVIKADTDNNVCDAPSTGLPTELGGADGTDDVDFSSDPGPVCTYGYHPTANGNGTDTAVTSIRIKPKGNFAATSAAGNPTCTWTSRARIK